MIEQLCQDYNARYGFVRDFKDHQFGNIPNSVFRSIMDRLKPIGQLIILSLGALFGGIFNANYRKATVEAFQQSVGRFRYIVITEPQYSVEALDNALNSLTGYIAELVPSTLTPKEQLSVNLGNLRYEWKQNEPDLLGSENLTTTTILHTADLIRRRYTYLHEAHNQGLVAEAPDSAILTQVNQVIERPQEYVQRSAAHTLYDLHVNLNNTSTSLDGESLYNNAFYKRFLTKKLATAQSSDPVTKALHCLAIISTLSELISFTLLVQTIQTLALEAKKILRSSLCQRSLYRSNSSKLDDILEGIRTANAVIAHTALLIKFPTGLPPERELLESKEVLLQQLEEDITRTEQDYMKCYGVALKALREDSTKSTTAQTIESNFLRDVISHMNTAKQTFANLKTPNPAADINSDLETIFRELETVEKTVQETLGSLYPEQILPA